MHQFNHPRLNTHEHRVALLVADGLTTKSIADLTGRSCAGIGRTRVSIRRKLRVPDGTSLGAHLQAQPPPNTAAHEQRKPRRRADPVTDDRRVQLVLRATIAEIARLAGRATKRAVDLSNVDGDPLAQAESEQLRVVAQRVHQLHDTLLSSVRAPTPAACLHVAASPDAGGREVVGTPGERPTQRRSA